MSNSLLIRNGSVLTLDSKNRVFSGDVYIEDGRIAALGSAAPARAAETIEAGGKLIIPGFVQTHVHLCQTLMRGSAEDLSLLDWLRERIWPQEAALTPESLYSSARLGISELLKGGSTCALTMESVHHTDAVFEAIRDSGFRATVGKCMMDKGDGVPDGLREDTDESLNESLRLFNRWHGSCEGRIRVALAPRFAVSCTRELLEQVSSLSRSLGVLVHTHASENLEEVSIVELETGRRNVVYLNELGLTGLHVVLAHCIWLDDHELELLRSTGTHVAHCPSSNLKLGSGIARVPEMLARGVSVSLGADGAPCNNRLDMFSEMRAAALIQKVLHGSETLKAASVLRMATINGARALGLGGEIGSIEVGKRADIVVVNLDTIHTTPAGDPHSVLVYAAQPSNVETVIVDGGVVVLEGRLVTLDEEQVLREAREQARRLRIAAGLHSGSGNSLRT